MDLYIHSYAAIYILYIYVCVCIYIGFLPLIRQDRKERQEVRGIGGKP